MATPAPRCSCCHAQRKSRGPEGHGDRVQYSIIFLQYCSTLRYYCTGYSTVAGSGTRVQYGYGTTQYNVQRTKKDFKHFNFI